MKWFGDRALGLRRAQGFDAQVFEHAPRFWLAADQAGGLHIQGRISKSFACLAVVGMICSDWRD